jgi:hypothetical protein
VSTILELAGMAGVVRGIDLLAGAGWAFVAAGLLVVFVGSVTDDGELNAAVRKSAGLPAKGFRLARRRIAERKARKVSGSRLPAVRA